MTQFGNTGDMPLVRVRGGTTSTSETPNNGSSDGGSPSTCTTPRPAAGWVCVNGGWLPPDHPLARGGS